MNFHSKLWPGQWLMKKLGSSRLPLICVVLIYKHPPRPFSATLSVGEVLAQASRWEGMEGRRGKCSLGDSIPSPT